MVLGFWSLVTLFLSGRIVPELKRSEIREIVNGNYRVIYKIKSSGILVLIVKSYRQKIKSEGVQG